MNEWRHLTRIALGVVAVLVAVLVAGLVVKATSVVASSRDRHVGAPPTSKLPPLPDGSKVLANRVFKSEGSLGADQRVIAFRSSAGAQKGENGSEAYLGSLTKMGWSRTSPKAALSPDSKICLTSVPLNDYMKNADEAEEVKESLRSLTGPTDSVGVVNAIFC